MTAVEGIFSLRIVTADFYMEKPKPGLDPCFSDFRAKEIKKVPIIRIFGSSAEGQKTCMHIHGVFPYLYIPYDKQDIESVDKAMYLIASSIDKAINISLGQGSSGSLHVFKIQLVKGIPFYGYHQKEHQYLKVYMLNPRFVRRTANLLQNGAILGKIFQPHESHVPYILQFFIDYNLYGMSFLHVPREVMKFRRKNENDEIKYPVKKEQILDCNVAEKQSTSQLELDIGAGFILNRFQLLSKTSEHTNPGIESIWQDERIRRLKMKSECEEVPPLEIPVSQERPDVKPTESHQFYRIGLISRLQHLEDTMDQTLNATMQSAIVPQEKSAKEKKRTFNLQKLIANAVYPEECTQHDNLTNASFIEDHLSSRSVFHTSAKFSETPSGPDSDDVFLDDTVVDEELILSLTQPEAIDQSLREEDMALLEVLQQLEEKEDGGEIDLDSTLAPLSQNVDLNSPQATVESGLIGGDRPTAGPHSDDSDNECLDNFSLVMDDMDELLLKLSQNSQARVEVPSIAQCDGSDDILLTPKRSKQRKLPTTPSSHNRITSGSPRTPRTPKSVANKYASLPLVIRPRSLRKALETPDTNKPNDDEAISESFEDCESFPRSAKGERKLLSLRKKLAITELRRKSISTDKAFFNEDESTSILKRKRKTSVDLDRTHITCSLRSSRKINERRLKVYNSADVPESPTPFCDMFSKNTDSETPSQRNATANKNRPDQLKQNATNSIKADKISQKVFEKESRNEFISPEKCPANVIKNNRSPRVKLKRWSPASPKKPKQSTSTNQISPKVLICRSPRIKEIISAENELSVKRKMKTRTRLSLSAHRKMRKEKKLESSEQSVTNANDSLICDSDPERAPTILKEQALTHKRMKKLKVRLKKIKIGPIIAPENSPKTPIVQNKPCPVTNSVSHSLIERFRLTECGSPRTPCRKEAVGEFDGENCNSVHSFYEKSFVVDSPVFSELSVPSPMQVVKCKQSVGSPSPDRIIIITPKNLPETYQDVEQNFEIYGIPDMVHQQPFYSSYTDVTHKKEVGHTVLRIPSKTLHDTEEFQSTIPNLVGFSNCRKQMMQLIGGSFKNDDHFREYLSTERALSIEPSKLPPTKQEAKVWLAARDVLQGKNVDKISHREEKFAEDSPIKIRRQKVVMLMENESGGSSEDMDCSMRSMSLTPLTPVTITKPLIPKSEELFDRTPLTSSCSGKKTERRRSLKAKKSLSQKLKDICITNALEQCSGESPQAMVNSVPADRLLKINEDEELRTSQESSKSNDTVTSEAVLAELNKSSFMKNLHSSQGSLDTSFGLSMATLNNTYGFKVNLENLQQAKADVEHNYLTTLSLELFVPTRDDLLPNPQFDPIICIFYTVENSIPSSCTDRVSKLSGFIIVSDSVDTPNAKFNGIASDIVIDVVTTELEGLHKFLEFCADWDPDIFVGYEIEMSSWGYMMERAKCLDFQIAPLLSRIPSQKVRDFIDEDRDQLTDLDVETKLCGRILLDVWRLMRSEIALTSYTFENVMYHILHRRCPLHVHKDLTQWFKGPHTRWIVLEYYLERVKGTLELLDQLDLIGRTSEMAKLIGIQFYEVLSRGSQFRVESMMLRIAKPRNLVPLSPSVQQRAHMRAPEYLPLILEPQSRFYPDPVIVLDFQSLYPSMIMAYNYCFSTCLGRVEHLGQSLPFEFGASQLRISPTLLRKLLDNELITISPCGVVYVKREVREGILPRMLSEVLDTRQMVKQSMKLHKSSTALQRILHSRQLGLKLIANVTYGYTAANFSGRMPCVEVGDSVVAKGRETLERAIKLVEANDKWNVKVVYGDTDSLFVLVPGRSRKEAFKIGAEIAELVTQDNPQPVKLKLEKVYQPCILQTKKRYVGYMYESPDQEEPIYEAKGIETVRRDGCPAAAKMLEKCLKILFEHADVSQVKSYVCRQFTKLLSGKANIQDLIFAKEFRGLNGYKPTACVPALELTRKWMQIDPRKIPRRGERVPFIVTNGPPGLPLIRLVRSPHDVLADEGLKINAVYYITKAIIPPLNRCFLLIGADVNEWFTKLPRKILFTPALSNANELIATTTAKKSTISQYFSSTNCLVDCGRQTKQGICAFCSVDASKTVVTLQAKISNLERSYYLTEMICQACCGRPNATNCASLDCPVLYVHEVKRRQLSQIIHMRNILEEQY